MFDEITLAKDAHPQRHFACNETNEVQRDDERLDKGSLQTEFLETEG